MAQVYHRHPPPPPLQWGVAKIQCLTICVAMWRRHFLWSVSVGSFYVGQKSLRFLDKDTASPTGKRERYGIAENLIDRLNSCWSFNAARWQTGIHKTWSMRDFNYTSMACMYLPTNIVIFATQVNTRWFHSCLLNNCWAFSARTWTKSPFQSLDMYASHKDDPFYRAVHCRRSQGTNCSKFIELGSLQHLNTLKTVSHIFGTTLLRQLRLLED